MTPEQVSTLMYVIVVLTSALIYATVALVVKEYKTLTDKIEGNHITAAVRAAWKAQPGAFLIVIVILAIALSYLGAHFFWGGVE